MNIEDNCVQSGRRGNVEMEVAIIFLSRRHRCLKEWRCVSERNVRTRRTIEGLWGIARVHKR